MKSSKKILGASAALGLAVALSAGSTFAWFTAGKSDVKVDSFDISATAQSDALDLKVALKATESGTLVANNFGYSVADLQSYVNNNTLVKDIGLKPLTLGKKATYDSADNDLYGEISTTAQKADKGYLTFTLVFGSDVQQKIYLLDTSSVAPSATKADCPNPITIKSSEGYGDLVDKVSVADYGGTSGTDYTVGSDQVTLKARAANAARVMFKQNTTVGVWSPNEYLYSGKTATSSDTQENTKAKGFYLGNLAADYNYIFTEVCNAAGDTNKLNDVGFPTDYTSASQKDYGAVAVKPGEAKNTPIATMVDASTLSVWGNSAPFNYAALVDITIWLEGTDGDCFDTILADAMSVVLNFKGVKVA